LTGRRLRAKIISPMAHWAAREASHDPLGLGSRPVIGTPPKEPERREPGSVVAVTAPWCYP
jgi:hypothetical protein